MEDKVLVLPVDSQTFEIENYSIEDISLISSQELDTNFSQSTDYIEYYIFDGNQNLIFPPKTEELLTYTVRDGHVLLDPKQDLEKEDFNEGTYYVNYNFYRKRLNSSISSKYYIQEISSDRTEIRLNSNTISNDDVQSSVQEFIQYRDSQNYFVDFYLNFGDNNLIISNNIKLDVTNEEDYSAIIKLYEPLPADFNLKSQCWVIETISSAQSYQVQFPVPIFDPQDFEYIAGPNLDLNIKNESGATSQEYSYDTLLSSNITSSNNQIQSLLDDKGIKININYDDFTNFIKFSSAKTRLENFYHKVGLIENYNSQISLLNTNVVSNTSLTSEFISSTSIFGAKVSDIIKNFDSYERFLYFNSGSIYSYPKTNSIPPYTLASTTSTEVKTWLGSSDSTNLYYGGLALQAYDFDQNNQDYLHWNIPEYLRDDSNNDQYGLFIDMVGQHFDNIWIYTKDVVNRFDADNRLDYGISKDLVADAIKDFGVKLYSNNFNTNDLYEAFLGITPSGITFPSTGSELINTQISASNDIIPLDDTNKRLYKRIYHNIPYLLKTKGTVAGLRALITSYGIPDTILRISEFGGKNPTNKQDWDYKQNIFNYALELDGNNYFSSSFRPNTNFSTSNPNTIQFRFKTPGLPENHISQSLFSIGEFGTSLLVLEYTGSSNISGSHSGSISDPYKEYGTLKFIPNTSTPSISASVYLPIFDNKWWSVMTTQNNLTASLSVANKIDNNLGFSDYNEITGYNSNSYLNSTKISFPHPSDRFFNSKTYTPFSGSIQEIRYYVPNISASSFEDFVLNPYAFKGNGFGAPNQLTFRADLGTLSLTGSRESIHPKITGSWSPTSSFINGTSDFYLSSESFIKNKEHIHLNQPHQGIKNKVTDRISLFDNIIPTGDTLSSKRSLQQYSYLTQSTTPDADYLEVAFSPTNQINDDIVAELGNFNIGEYIGDPRHMSESRTNYPDLDALRDQYFLKYIKSYDVKDFIRLIKYFDNSLFKMIKDFTPARTNLSSGVVIKQHILERNAYSARPVSQEDVTYSGSVKSFARGYETGSIEVFKGGTGGVFEKFNSLNFYKSGSDGNGPDNIFGVTQSWSDSFSSTGSNNIEYPRDDQREFYNGEFSQSAATIGIIDICGKYLNFDNVPELLYRLEYFSGSDDLYTVLPYSFPPIQVLNEYYVNYAEDGGVLGNACEPNGSISIFTNVSSILNITAGTIMYSDIAGEYPWVGGTGTSMLGRNVPKNYGIREINGDNERTMAISDSGVVIKLKICLNLQYWRLRSSTTAAIIYTPYNPAYAVTNSVNVGNQSGCFTILSAETVINNNLLPLPENQYISSICVPPTPTLTPIALRYSTATSTVCSQNLEPRYSINTLYFSNASKIFFSNTGEIATSGWYSEGNIKRFYSDGVLGTMSSCTNGGGYGDYIDENDGQFCFVAGTSIELESGTHKFIENIIIGDNVVTFNEETKLKETGKVYEILSPTHYDIVTYLLDDGTVVSSTEDHPYYIQDGDQLKLKSKKPEDTNSRYDIDQEVYQIKLQDNMIKSDGALSKIIDMTTERSEGTQTYLLRVDHNHNFYANGVLVHNK